jgi:chorismate mutase
MWCRGIRGATTADSNTKDDIIEATIELLQQMIEANGIQVEDVASAFFTTTSDLNAEFPALAARQLGWVDTALLCGHEMNVTGALSQCIRVLVHVNTERSASEVKHIYVKGAKVLRPSLAEPKGE